MTGAAKLKILVVSNLYPPFQIGGYEIGCRNVVTGLRERGHAVTVLTAAPPFDAGPEEDDIRRNLDLCEFTFDPTPPIEIARFLNIRSRVSNWHNTQALVGHLTELRPDLVYFFNIWGIGGLALLDAARSLGYPVAIHLMDSIPCILAENVPADVLALFDAHDGALYQDSRVLAMSRSLVDEIESRCGFQLSAETELVPGWADTEPNLFEREYAKDGRIRFVAAGTISEEKGVRLIIEAVARLKAEGYDGFDVRIFGPGDVGVYIDLCKRLSVSDIVSFPGRRTQTELREIYETADAFLFPTWEREPFGFAPVEAAAVGCVPIITDNAGVAERLVDNVHCLKIRRTSDALKTRLREVLDDPSILRTIGTCAQVITRHDLSFAQCLDRIERILGQTAATGRRRPRNHPGQVGLFYLKHNLTYRLMNYGR